MDPKVQRTFQEAQELYRQERWAEALVVLDDLSLSYKSDKDIMLNRAMCLARIGKEEEAELLCDHLTVVHNDVRGAQLKAQIPQAKREGKDAPKEAKKRSMPLSPQTLKRAMVVIFVCSLAAAAWTFYSTYRAPAPPSIATAPAPGARTLSFPDETPIGTVAIRSWGYSTAPEGDHTDNWKVLGPAVGRVEVPAGKEVQLSVEPGQIGQLSSLRWMGSDDIQDLSLRNCLVGDADMAHIDHLTGLFELDITNSQVGPAGYEKLYRLTSLRDITIIGTTLGEPGRALIASQSYVTKIDADGADLGDEWLQGLPPLEHLIFLSLDEIEKITDEGIVHIAKHKNLKKLFLSYTQLTDKSMPKLQQLTYLDRFWMENTAVTDASMAGFRTMPHIAEIGIAYTEVTSEGLMQLSGIDSLRKVGIRGCKNISLEAARRFKAQNPEVVVETAMNL